MGNSDLLKSKDTDFCCHSLFKLVVACDTAQHGITPSQKAFLLSLAQRLSGMQIVILSQHGRYLSSEFWHQWPCKACCGLLYYLMTNPSFITQKSNILISWISLYFSDHLLDIHSYLHFSVYHDGELLVLEWWQHLMASTPCGSTLPMYCIDLYFYSQFSLTI